MNGLAPDPLDAALVRLKDGQRIMGAGFLIAPGVIVTCAHVVGDGELVADFPLLSSSGHTVEVLERDDELDVAILSLADPPPGALPVPARISGDVRDHQFRTIGFPADLPEGIWVTGRLVGAQGGGRIQMAQDADHWRIEPGFSGAPVWDTKLAGVVGMVVTTTARNAVTAHLVPTTALGDAWTAPARNPYRGLRPFGEDNAKLFRGRDAEIDWLSGLVERKDIVAIAGPSGCGKSSLVHAGLSPRLKRAGTRVVVLGSDDEIPDVSSDTLVVLDQFEEEVVENPLAARKRIAAITRAVSRSASLKAVLTLRSRSLDELITRETVQELNRAVWFLEPMSREQLALAIEEPAKVVGGLAFESGLVQRILDDTSDEPGTLPLVSLVLEQLCENRHGGWLTHRTYDELGRVPGALSRHADSALPEPDELDNEAQAEQKEHKRRKARSLLVRLTRPDGEGGYARRHAKLADLDPELQEVAGFLAAERLLVIEDQRVDLAHQALIDHWPQLREWLAEDADFIAWQAKLQELESSGVLLRGAALAEASGWLDERGEEVPAWLGSFIRRSVAAQNRTRRRWRIITTVSTTLALVSTALTGVVVNNARELDRTLRATNSTLIAEEANRATQGDPVTALQLALAAWKENPGGADAYGALLQHRLAWSGVDRALPPQLTGEVSRIASSSDGRVLAFTPKGPTDRVVVWWDVLGPNPTSRKIKADSPGQFELSPDGRRLVLYDSDAGLQVWDLADPEGQPTVLETRKPFGQPTFSANSRYMTAVRGYQGEPFRARVRVWDLRTMRELPSQVGYERTDERLSIADAYPTPDGRALVTLETRQPADEGGNQVVTPVVRDRETGADIKTFPPVDEHAVVLLGGGTHLGVCTDNSMAVHDSFTGAVTGRFPVPKCLLALDETGRYLLPVAPSVRSAVHWRTGQHFRWPELETSAWDGDEEVVTTRPDGTRSVLDVHGGAVRVASATTGQPTVIDNSVQPTDRSADGQRWIAYEKSSTNEPGDLVLRDSRGETLDRTSISPKAEALAFDASGERVLVGSGATLRIFRTDGLVLEREVRLPLPEGRDASDISTFGESSLLTVPTGELLVTQAGMLSSWDVRTGRQTSSPIMLEEPEDPPNLLPRGPDIVPRPQHPGQIVVRTRDSVLVWDYRERERLYEFPVALSTIDAEPPVVSADGSIVATVDWIASTATLIDLRAGRVLPQLNGELHKVLGVSEEYLFAEGDSSTNLEVWDWSERRRIAAVTLPAANLPELVGNELVTERPGYRHTLPLNPAAWFRDLCRISDREFTTGEKRLLPNGASHERPCE